MMGFRLLEGKDGWIYGEPVREREGSDEAPAKSWYIYMRAIFVGNTVTR